MKTLLYSNTADGVLLPTGGKNSDRTVLVETEAKGHELIAQWNINSKNHCKGRYVYAVVSMKNSTKEEIATLDLYGKP